MSDNLDLSSPRPDKESFCRYWTMYLPDIEDRENIKQSHLAQLRILCDQCVEYDELQNILDLEGRTYISVGRNGEQVKPRPEYMMMAKCVVEIRNYSKMLGLILVKDTKFSESDDKNEFD